MSDPENETKSGKRVSKHTRLRYYTSYEEATIVKLWREHFAQISSYSENLPIFRDIAFGLQHHRIRLNKQEVRRRINSYRNKYLLERNRLESDPQYKSSWRLYSLIDCLFQPATSSADTVHERSFIDQIESNIRNELPSLPRFNRHDCKTMKYEQHMDKCPFLEADMKRVKIKCEPQQTLPLVLPQVAALVKSEIMSCDEMEPINQLSMPTPTEKRSPLAPANRILEANNLDFASMITPIGARRPRRRSIMPRTGQITIAQIERLRQENDLLAEQRDAHLADLELKEREYQQLEQTFDFWIHQQETWMAYLDERGIK